MKARLSGFAALGTALVLAACLPTPLGAAGHGKVAIAVRWPASAQYTLMAIPEGTRRVDVSISGVGIPLESALKQSLTPEAGKAESDTFIEVPIGPKLVQAKAYDAAGKLLAQGEVQVLVSPNQVVDARVVLQPPGFSPPPSLPPSELPSESPSPQASPSSPEPSATNSAAPSPAAGLQVRAFSGNGLGERVDASNLAGAGFRYPRQLVHDAPRGLLWVADDEGHALRRVDLREGKVDTAWPRALGQSTGVQAALAPTATRTSPPPVKPTIAGMTLGPDGALYFADPARHGVYRFDPSVGGDPQRWAGGTRGYAEGERLTGAAFHTPMAIAFGPTGEAYVADWGNRRVRRISPGGTVTTVAGTGDLGTRPPQGDAFRVAIGQPGALALDPSGGLLYVVEPIEGRVLRLVLATGNLSVALGGRVGTEGEGGLATAASLSLPLSVAFDAQGQLVVADGWGLVVGDTSYTGLTSRVLRVGAEARVERVAGQSNQAFGYSGDGGEARLATFNNPAGLAFVPGLGLVVSDAYNHRLRLLVPAGDAPPLGPSPSPAASPSPSPAASLSPSPSAGPSADPKASA